VHTAGGASHRHWLKVHLTNGLNYLLTYFATPINQPAALEARSTYPENKLHAPYIQFTTTPGKIKIKSNKKNDICIERINKSL